MEAKNKEAKKEELENLLSEIRLKGRRSHTRNIVLISVPLLAGVLWLLLSLYQVRKVEVHSSGLSKQVQKQSQMLTEMEKSIERANEILKALASPEALERRKAISINYAANSSSREKVESALEGLGFARSKIKWVSSDTAINAISYDKAIDQDDVKLVAYAFIRTGAQIKEIEPFPDSSAQRSLITVYSIAANVNKPALTVEEIRDRRLNFAFPVIGSYRNLNDAVDFARKVKQSIIEYEPEVYLSDNGYYGVTLGGYLDGEEAKKRVAFAKSRNVSSDGNPYVRVSVNWGNNLIEK